MNARTVCIPLNSDGTIHDRLGQARVVAICQVDGDDMSDWVEHTVEWDTTRVRSRCTWESIIHESSGS